VYLIIVNTAKDIIFLHAFNNIYVSFIYAICIYSFALYIYYMLNRVV